ncbi:MAG: glycosyltransferase, partial [Gammaproteobacteria bacterium]
MNLSELTVIVPTRNEEKNIPRFLASVPEAVELIVVDASD